MAELRSAIRARLDAVRQGELLALEAKLLIGRAGEAELAVLRRLAEAHGFDPDAEWDLRPDGALIRASAA